MRSTGSGMGCPDWPKCFGSWVPPQSIKDLPENYKEIYSKHREKKNLSFVKYLRAFGLNETANKILNDKSVLQEADFNITKTWIEYLNRIIGVIIGFLIFSVFIKSLRFRKTDLHITLIASLTFLLVVIQGWIGSIVVSTNLTPWIITFHMFLALVIVALLIYLIAKSADQTTGVAQPPIAFWWTMACIGVLLVQILLGTQVREAIDAVSQTTPRADWISSIQSAFSIHRSFSWIVLILHVGLIVNLRKTHGLKAFPLVLILLILATILSGIGMAYLGVPAFLQPVHLLCATASFGMQFMLLLRLKQKVKADVSLI